MGSSKKRTFLILEMAAYSSGAIFGPLIVFIGGGFYFDKFFETSPLFLVIGFIIAFIVTNILLVMRLKKVYSKYSSWNKKQ